MKTINIELYNEIKSNNPDLSLDEVLYEIYERVNDGEDFDILRSVILKEIGINELEYYTKDVNKEIIDYITNNIFREYSKNDGGHNIVHIIEVIRRSFALNDTFKLHLDPNMIYVIASYHDLGKYIDHEKHHLIAAEMFMNDEFIKKFFNDEEIKTIKEAIEDHRSSREDEPRSIYGKLISSADRNTRIEIVFIRSFFVAQERDPDMIIEDYLDYTIKRLSKKYSEDSPENMFFEDKTYLVFLDNMRKLLKNESLFKERYCSINNITNRNSRVIDNKGNLNYIKGGIYGI